MARAPNFFIVGAPKCGTTSLATWLSKHPNVYMSPVKEPWFFSTDIHQTFIGDWKAYQRLFEAVRPEQTAVGEASTSYLFSRLAVPSIESRFPDSRYIVMLRDPVEMAYSLHDQQIRVENETVLDFAEAWHLSPERRAWNRVPPRCKDPILLDYQSFCLLGEQVERLYASTTADRVLVLILDELKQDKGRVIGEIARFLGVPERKEADFPTENRARRWRSPLLGKLVRRLSKGVVWAKYRSRILPRRSLGLVRGLEKAVTVARAREPLSPALEDELRQFYAEDVLKLERILDRDLTRWREG